MEKTCFKCKRTKPIEQFYAHPEMADGYLNKCKACTKRDVASRYADPVARQRIQAYERERARSPARRAKVLEYQHPRLLRPDRRHVGSIPARGMG